MMIFLINLPEDNKKPGMKDALIDSELRKVKWIVMFLALAV